MIFNRALFSDGTFPPGRVVLLSNERALRMRTGRGGTHPRRHFFISYGMLHLKMTTEAPLARRVQPLGLWCLQQSLVSTFVPVSYENTMKTSRQAVAGAPERRGRASEVRRWSRTSSLCVPSAGSGQTPANTQRRAIFTQN